MLNFGNRRSAVSRLAAGLLVFALLWTQWLGVVHQEIHPALPSQAQQHSHAAPSALHTLLEQLLGHHADGIHAADCRLYDQLSHADVMPAVAPALVLPPVWPVVFVAALATRALPPGHAWFDARGPPHLC
jgi:tryptophan-rich sensory protein